MRNVFLLLIKALVIAGLIALTASSELGRIFMLITFFLFWFMTMVVSDRPSPQLAFLAVPLILLVVALCYYLFQIAFLVRI